MIRLLHSMNTGTGRSRLDAVLLSDLAGQLITETSQCGELRFGNWLFLARLGEGIPITGTGFENRLWIASALITPDTERPAIKGPGLRLDGTLTFEKDSNALEIIAATDGLAGIAIHLDRNNRRNDDLIWALTCRLEPRHPDDQGPVVWYGRPPQPPSVPSRDEAAHDAAGDRT